MGIKGERVNFAELRRAIIWDEDMEDIVWDVGEVEWDEEVEWEKEIGLLIRATVSVFKEMLIEELRK